MSCLQGWVAPTWVSVLERFLPQGFGAIMAGKLGGSKNIWVPKNSLKQLASPILIFEYYTPWN